MKCLELAVALFVKALRYKLKGRGFDSRWCHWQNPCGRIMALGSTLPLIKLMPGIFAAVKGTGA